MLSASPQAAFLPRKAAETPRPGAECLHPESADRGRAFRTKQKCVRVFCQRPAACWGPAAMPESIRTGSSPFRTRRKTCGATERKHRRRKKHRKLRPGISGHPSSSEQKIREFFSSGQRDRTDNSAKPYKSLAVTRLTERTDIFLCFGARPDRARPKESTRFAARRRKRRPVRRANRNTARISPASTIGGGRDRLRKMRYSGNTASPGGSGNREAHMKIR